MEKLVYTSTEVSESLFNSYEMLPDYIKNQIDTLKNNYPLCSKILTDILQDLFSSIDLNKAVHHNPSNNSYSLKYSYIFQLTDQWGSRLRKKNWKEIKIGKERAFRFGFDLLKLIKSIFIFSREIKFSSPKMHTHLMYIMNDVSKKNVALNGPNSVILELDKAIETGLNDASIDEIGFQKNCIPAIENSLPYPFEPGNTNESVVKLLHQFLISKGKIDCSENEFLAHLVNGCAKGKLIWLGNLKELVWIHCLMNGGTARCPGASLMKCDTIHKLTSFHFVDKSGKEIRTNTLSVSIVNDEYYPEKSDFLQEFLVLIKRLS